LSKNKLAVDKKIEDLTHNLDQSRNFELPSEKDMKRIAKYKIALAYLIDVKKGHVSEGSSVVDYVLTSPHFSGAAQARALQTVLDNSLSPDELENFSRTGEYSKTFRGVGGAITQIPQQPK
jgi:hypothetical protein